MRVILALCVPIACIFFFMDGARVWAQPKTVTELTKTVTFNHQLAAKDPFDKQLRTSRCKTYKYKFKAGREYEITLVSTNFDAYLRLENSAGRNVAQDDDGAGNLNSRILFTPTKTDAYTVVATSLGGRMGNYALTIRPMGKRKMLLNVNAKLTATDPYDVMQRSSRHKCYEIKMEKGKTYRIDYMSRNYDCYLRVEDFRGNQIIADDDGGQGLNSRIVFRPTATDTHRIIVTTLGSNQLGDYQLIVAVQ